MEDQRMVRTAEALAHINFRSLATAQKQATKAKRFFVFWSPRNRNWKSKTSHFGSSIDIIRESFYGLNSTRVEHCAWARHAETPFSLTERRSSLGCRHVDSNKSKVL